MLAPTIEVLPLECHTHPELLELPCSYLLLQVWQLLLGILIDLARIPGRMTGTTAYKGQGTPLYCSTFLYYKMVVK